MGVWRVTSCCKLRVGGALMLPCRCEVVNNELDLALEGEGEGEQPPPTPANKLPKDFAVVVDAANTPQRLAQVLDGLREAGAKRIFTVFGCDGQVGPMYHNMWCDAHSTVDAFPSKLGWILGLAG